MTAVMDYERLVAGELDAERRIVEALARRFDSAELSWIASALELGREQFERFDEEHDTVTDALGLVGRASELRVDD